MGIGTREEAMQLLEIAHHGPKPNEAKVRKALKENGWALIGSGSYRDAWLSPSGVVYKVETDDYYAPGDTYNEDEYFEAMRLADMEFPDFIVIPEVDTYEVAPGVHVNAMEYVEGRPLNYCYKGVGRKVCRCGSGVGKDGKCDDERWMDLLYDHAPISDIHGQNVVLRPDNKIVIIDLQS